MVELTEARYRTFWVSTLIICLCVLLQQDSFRNLALSIKQRAFGIPAAYECEDPKYKARFISYDPVMIHLENFITPSEREYLLDLSIGNLQRSRVMLRNGTHMESQRRTSSTAYIDIQNPVSRCLAKRVTEFQGFESIDEVERLQVTAYKQGQQYEPHVDYTGRSGRDRGSTFFGILEADCDNCGTRFPQLPVNWTSQDERWCRIVDCTSNSITVLPLPGSVFFWRNLHPDGTPDPRTRHAGLPLTRGSKTAVNIWTLQAKE